MKVVQYGNITETYEYEKNRPDYKERYVSALTKKRLKKSRELAKVKGVYRRKTSSILRSVKSFFNLCHHNNCLSSSVHFFTLTFAYDLTYKTACRHVARFMERIKKDYPKVPVSYISVSERTKKGRYHFHLLVYDLPPETTQFERKTRNFQRLFERGYVDICFAGTITTGIAGYMAKYMGKSLNDEKNETTRGYNCSRNIRKPYRQGSNTLNTYKDMIIPTEGIVDEEKREYDVPYLGKCLYTRITKQL